MFLRRKIIYVLAIFSVFFLCRPAQAAVISNFEFDTAGLDLNISGLCGGYKVAVHLTEANEILYSGETECQDGEFIFRDNLNVWKFAPGKYFVQAYDVNSPLENPSEQKEITIDNNIVLLANENSQEYVEEETRQELDPNIFEKIINFISQWIRSAIVTFKELATEKITTSRLCVGNTCIEENDLKGFLKSENKKDNQLNEDVSEKNNDELIESDTQNSDFEILDANIESASSTDN